jgi:hypothetical protein
MYTLYIFKSILLNITYIVNVLYHALGDTKTCKVGRDRMRTHISSNVIVIIPNNVYEETETQNDHF